MMKMEVCPKCQNAELIWSARRLSFTHDLRAKCSGAADAAVARRSNEPGIQYRSRKPLLFSTFLYLSLPYSTLSETSADGQDLEVSILGWSFRSVDYRTFEAHPVPERGRFMPCVVAVYLWGRRVVLLCALPGGSSESF